MSTDENMPFYPQHGDIYCGAKDKTDAYFFGLGLSQICAYQIVPLQEAMNFAFETSKTYCISTFEKREKERVDQQKRMIHVLCTVFAYSPYNSRSDSEIRSIFEVYGPIKSISSSSNNRPAVTYWNPESVMICINNKSEVYDKYQIIIQRSVPGEVNNVKEALVKMFTISRAYNRIFVTPIHTDLTEKNLIGLFEAFGEICDIQVIRLDDVKTGFAFIQYEEEKAALDAINSMDNTTMAGHQIYVCECITPPKAHKWMYDIKNQWLDMKKVRGKKKLLS